MSSSIDLPERERVNPVVQFSLFGRFRVWSDTVPDLLPRTRKSRAVLAILAIEGGRPVRRTRIAGMLWDRVPEEQARNSLRQALSELGTALRAAGTTLIDARRDDLRLTTDACAIDLDTFEAAAPGERVAWPQAPLLEDLADLAPAFDQWLHGERARVDRRLRERMEAEIERLCRADASPEQRIAAARDLLARDATHERAWRLIIRSLADMGDTGQALREYIACEAALRRLLDAAPSAETRALRDQLRGTSPAARPMLPPAPTTLRPVRPAAVPARPVAPAVAPPDHNQRQASIAVLPFAAPAGQADAILLANGLVEGVIHELSGLGDLFVIGRGTSLAYNQQPLDPRVVGAELGVRYILSGSVSSAGSRLRIFNELTETAGGSVVRADRRNVALDDLFDLQDTLTAEIVSAIAPSVRENELARARRKPPSSLTAYDLLLRGLDRMSWLEPTAFNEAGRLLRRGMELDPGFAAVRSHAATWHNYNLAQGWSTDAAADTAAAARLAGEALERDHNDAVALAIQGQTLSFTRRDYSAARHFLDRAISVGPSASLAWTLSSTTHGWTGDGASAVEHAMRGLRLSPRDPFAFFTEHMVSQGHYVSGDFAEAVRWGRKALASNPMLTSNLRTLSAALVMQGEIEAAREVAAQVLKLQPDFSLRRFLARTPFSQSIRDAHGERLRLAGLPN
ncbi:MAG: BTAD domain-containing putative transcriptional regulator [Pseudomonadota bacterium]